MLPSAYLTDRQLEIWAMGLRGLNKAEIGRALCITRQAVCDAEGVMMENVDKELMHAAKSNMMETRHHIFPTLIPGL